MAQNEIELEKLSGKPKVSQSISSWARIQNNSDFKTQVLSTAPRYLWARTASALGAYFPGTPENNTGSAYLQMNSTSRFLSSLKSRVLTHSRQHLLPYAVILTVLCVWRVTLPSDGAILQSSRNPTNSSIDENCCCTPALTFQSIIVLLREEWPLGYLQFSSPNSSMASLFEVKARKIVNLPEAFQNILTLISSLVHPVHLLFWPGTQLWLKTFPECRTRWLWFLVSVGSQLFAPIPNSCHCSSHVSGQMKIRHRTSKWWKPHLNIFFCLCSCRIQEISTQNSQDRERCRWKSPDVSNTVWGV